jgi:hypothetical protein
VTGSANNLVADIDHGIQELRRILRVFLPPIPSLIEVRQRLSGETANEEEPSENDSSLPAANVSLVRVEEKPVGLGNQPGGNGNGNGSRALVAVPMKGDRLKATARFQVWGTTLQSVDDTIDELHQLLLVAKGELHKYGFLSLATEATPVAEYVAALDAWYKTTTYNILYEFLYPDPDTAGGLIAQIKVTVAGDLLESTEIAQDMKCWYYNQPPPGLPQPEQPQPEQPQPEQPQPEQPQPEQPQPEPPSTLDIRGDRARQITGLMWVAFVQEEGQAENIVLGISTELQTGEATLLWQKTYQQLLGGYGQEPQTVTLNSKAYKILNMSCSDLEISDALKLLPDDAFVHFSCTYENLSEEFSKDFVIYLRLLR